VLKGMKKIKEKKRLMTIDKENKRLRDENDKLKDKLLASKDKTIKVAEDTIEIAKDAIKSNKATNKITKSLIDLLNKYLPDVPELKCDVDQFQLKNEILAPLITEDYKTKIINYVSKLFIKYYQKNDFNEQSLWSTDRNRLHYINRQRDDEDNVEWKNDSYGLFVKQKVLRLLVKHIARIFDNNYKKMLPFLEIVLPSEEDVLERTKAIGEIGSNVNMLNQEETIDNITDVVFKKVSKLFILDRQKLNEHINKQAKHKKNDE
jgi:hypothetical protein